MDVDGEELKLNCWIRSQDPRWIFQVVVPKTANVFELQAAIKNTGLGPLRDMDEGELSLYKVAVSIPYEENLKKLVLSGQHFLYGPIELSNIFRESLSIRDIHIIVDVQFLSFWLRETALDADFSIPIRPRDSVNQLKSRIKDEQPKLRDTPNHLIRLYGVSEKSLEEFLNTVGAGELLQKNVAHNFLDVPVLDRLCVVIDVLRGDGSPTPVNEPIANVDEMQEYHDIIIRVGTFKRFEEDDKEKNWINEAPPGFMIPEFVETFERKLLDEPYLPPNEPMLQTSGAHENYFQRHQDSNAQIPQKEIRDADLLEVLHTTYHIAHYTWQDWWKSAPLEEPAVDAIFFRPLLYNPDRRDATISRDQSWPITVVVKRENENELRRFTPRSDFCISKSELPRLIVEINSEPQSPSPKNRNRMLVTGAFIVRFANNFVRTFSIEKNFVLCAFFVMANGVAIRHILYQIPNDQTVYYNEREFKLDDPLHRVQFARHLYHLRPESDQDQAANDAVQKLLQRIMKSMMQMLDQRTTVQTGRKCARTAENNHDDAANEGGLDGQQLRGHGYEVEPDIVDDSGGIWELIGKRPDNILTVYKPMNPDKKFIAKKSPEVSNELEIFRLLDTIPIKSDHIISLVEAFGEWAILPKMATISGYLDSKSNIFESKISRVCFGLIEGLAYLHEHCIAHRDIKPDNLVVDRNLNLKIIDFDIAMQVKDEDEEVDDQSGTRGWMAPEVEKKMKHSPIKADRWACGRVLLYILDSFRKEDAFLRPFARELMAHNPNQRPSLLEWESCSTPPVSNAANIGKSDSMASRLQRDHVEVDGEITNAPNAKKQRI